MSLLITRLQDVTFERFVYRLSNELRFFRHNRRTAKLLRRHGARFGNPHLFVIGARSGLDLRWRSWVRKGLVAASGVEPDENECARLRRADPELTLYSLALGDRSGPAQFYRTASPFCSSCLEPDFDVLSAYPLVAEMCAIEAVASVELSRFSDVFPKPISEIPDFLQIDVQGFEYQVLEGFGKCLEEVLCIEQESHFKPLYKGTRTFPEVKEYLEGRGFILRHLEPIAQEHHGGEAVQCNAFFVRRNRIMTPKERSLIGLWEQICNLPGRQSVLQPNC